MNRLFASDGQSIGASASVSVLPMNIQGWFPLGWTGLISLQSKRPSRVFSSTTSVLWHSAFFMVQLSHLYMTIGKSIVSTIRTFVSKAMSLLYNTLSSFVMVFLPRSKCLLVSGLQSLYQWFWSLRKENLSISILSLSIGHEVMGPDAIILVFSMLNFKSAFSLSSFTFIKRLFSSCLFSAVRVMLSAYLTLLIFLLAILIPVCDSSGLAFCLMYTAYQLSVP